MLRGQCDGLAGIEVSQITDNDDPGFYALNADGLELPDSGAPPRQPI